MKIFQIFNDLCYWDASEVVPNLEFAVERYSPEIKFVEAPNYVFEGWGYDKFKQGEDRFVKPVPPEGWIYDDLTGTFYPEGESLPSTQDFQEEPAIEDVFDILLEGLE